MMPALLSKCADYPQHLHALSKTAAASGRWASALWCGTSAVPSIMPGSASPLAADDGIEINSDVRAHGRRRGRHQGSAGPGMP